MSPALPLPFPRPAALALALVLALLGGGCAAVPVSPAPRVATASLPKAEADRATANLRVFDTVWGTVHRKYYDPTFNGLDWQMGNSMQSSSPGQVQNPMQQVGRHALSGH